MKPTRQITLVLLLFTAIGFFRHLHQFGEDLGSSYIGCRLLAVGKGDHLYSHDTYVFSKVGDPVWRDMAIQTGFLPLRLVHPYVQTPLWAWSLEPICTRMNYRPFCNGFILVFMLCTSGLLWLVARYWAPSLFHPGWLALIALLLYRSEPFKYAIFLAQTHILYVLMTVLALILAEQRRWFLAGLLLALAAAVKITPGILFLYWLMTRQFKAAFAFALVFCALALLTVGLFGFGLTHTYLQSLSFDSNVLLRAFNNQSLAAWWTTLSRPRAGMLQWGVYPLPEGLKLLCNGLTLAAAVAGGWLDRRIRERTSQSSQGALPPPPFGANIALLAVTLCAPIAWTHYFIMLVIPLMLFLDRNRQRRSWGWIALMVGMLLLNYYPLSVGAVHVYYKSFTIIRSQFYSGVLAIGGLAYLAHERLREHSFPMGSRDLPDLAMSPGA